MSTRLFLLAIALSAAAFLPACSGKGKKPVMTSLVPDHQISKKDMSEIEALVDKQQPVTLSVLIKPDGYADAMAKIGAYEKRGLLRVVFNPNRSLTEIDAAPFLIVELAPELFDDIEVGELLGHFDLDAAALDRPFAGSIAVKDASPLAAPGPGSAQMPLDAIQARALGASGKKVRVAVVDSGVDMDHPLLRKGPSGKAKIVDFIDLTRELDFELAPAESDDLAAVKAVLAKAGVPAVESALIYTTRIREHRLVGTRDVRVDLNGDGATEKEYLAYVVSTADLTDAAASANAKTWVALDADGDGQIAKSEVARGFRLGESMELIALGAGRNRGLRKVAFKVAPGWGPVAPRLSMGLDMHGHGTHVAGIIAGYQEGSSLQGVAPDAEIMNVRVLGATGRGNFSAFYAGLVYAAVNGAHVANMSLGGQQRSELDSVAQKLLRYLAQRYGMLIVVAAGNDGPTLNTSNDPGAFESVVTVGAYNPIETMRANYGEKNSAKDTFFYWSSRGPTKDGLPKPDVVAPGGLLSSLPQASGSGPLMVMNGTSMATPMVAGAAALLLEKALASRNALVTKDTHGSVSQRPLALKRALQEGAKPIAGLSFVDQGYGLVQLEASLGALAGWDKTFREIRKELPGYRLFRYLTYSGHFVEATKSENGLKPVKIVEQDDISLPKADDKIDETLGLDVSTEAEWLELVNAAGQRQGKSIEGIQAFTRNSSFAYEIVGANRRDGNYDTAWIDVRDSRSGVSQGRVLAVNYHPLVLDSEPTLLDDGVSELTYVKRFPEVELAATELRRFFVRVPPGTTSLGVRTRALGRGTGFEPADVGVFVSNFETKLANDVDNVEVRDGRVKLSEDYVNVPVGPRGLVEVAVFGFPSVKTSRFSLEIRASGLAAQPLALMGEAMPEAVVRGGESLGREAKVSVSAQPWMTIRPLTPASSEKAGVELAASEVLYYPIELEGEVAVLVQDLKGEDSFDWSLLDSDFNALKEDKHFAKSPRGLMHFAKKTKGWVAIAGSIGPTPSTSVTVSLVTVTAFSPTVALEEGAEYAAKVTQAQVLPGFAVSAIDWKDATVGPSPTARTTLFYMPGVPGGQGATPSKQQQNAGRRVLEMLLDRSAGPKQD